MDPSTAIIGGLGLAGSIGAGLFGAAGANAGAAQAREAGQEAYQANQAQIQRSGAVSSPYTALGANAVSQIGALLGYGSTSWGPNGLQFQNDPNAQANAIAQTRAFANASGATMPTYHPINVSDTFEADPSYAWRLSQGVGAQDASAAAKGTLLSGAQQQALTNYGQNAASQEYQNWFNRLSQATGQNFGQQQQIYNNQQTQWNNALAMLTGNAAQGAGTGTSLNNANTAASSASGNALTSAGNASAGLTAQAGQDLASGIGAGTNAALQAYLLRNAFGATGGGGSVYDAAKNAYTNTATAGSYGGQSGYFL